MIAIIDYGMGNLRSVQKALESVGAEVEITDSPARIERADKLVLPGVGAIRPAMNRLGELGLTDSVRRFIKSGRPFLGICLGYQLLFESSDEGGSVEGLGILKGRVSRFTEGKVPHMGWNRLDIKQQGCPLLQGVGPEPYAYFCHSYYVAPGNAAAVLTTTGYVIDFASSIAQENIFATQFHPEKSQTIGLTILKNFSEVRT